MRRHFITALAGAGSFIISSMCVAAAADIPPAQPYRAPAMVAAPVFSWSGIYVGFNVGYGSAKAEAFGLSENLNGVISGGQIGGNWQNGPFVVGIEADFQGSLQSKTTNFVILGIPVTEKDSVPWFGTVRGRVGAAFDRVFVYATGGWAYTQFKIEGTALGATLSSNTNKGALVYGGGVEWMFANRWSAKLEYLRFDTGTTNVTLLGFTFPAKLTDNIARFGVNFHF